MENVIEAAVKPLKQDAIDRAEKEARAAVAKARETLKANNNDLQIVAPYPTGSLPLHEYWSQLSRYKFFSAITIWRQSSYRLNEPHYADVDSNKVAKFVKEAKEDAAAQYDAFVAKLNAKIGPAKSARLEGNHVWSYSHLFVETASGEQQIWKTQMIINTSKLGKIFNQFPTRKVKAAK